MKKKHKKNKKKNKTKTLYFFKQMRVYSKILQHFIYTFFFFFKFLLIHT